MSAKTISGLRMTEQPLLSLSLITLICSNVDTTAYIFKLSIQSHVGVIYLYEKGPERKLKWTQAVWTKTSKVLSSRVTVWKSRCGSGFPLSQVPQTLHLWEGSGWGRTRVEEI